MATPNADYPVGTMGPEAVPPPTGEPVTLPPSRPNGNLATLPPGPAMAATATLPPESMPAPAGAAGLVPGYEILAELGRGGMGVVYKARQVKLDRLVALKMILAGGHASSADLDRFRTEAEAIARLQHPNIVQVHEVGEHDGKPFFSLEFCAGGSLDRKLDGTPLKPLDAARLVEVLASAMQAAHNKSVIHRDLKPANILLTADGTPKITDFGLAKKLDVAAQTTSGAIMGTPSYMAPEQAGMASPGRKPGEPAVGPACDIYALGAILYELLTGRPPFKAATPLDTVLQVVSDEPVPPTQLQSRTPRDLETICLKCLHKEPGKRYATAAALAEDLKRFQEGVPVLARPVGRIERGWRWCRRNPAVAVLAATVALVLLLGAGVGTGLAVFALAEKTRADSNTLQANEAAQRADAETGKAKQAEQGARDQLKRTELALYAGQLAQAQQEWHDNNKERALEILEACQWNLRHFEHHLLWTLYQSNQRVFRGHTGPVSSVATSPDGQFIVSGSRDKTIKVWDARNGLVLHSLGGHTAFVFSVCLSPDGKRIVSGSGDNTLKVWDSQTGKEMLTLKGHTEGVNSVKFSPDGKRIASGSMDDTLRVWDARTGQELLSLNEHTPVWCVAYSLDGKRIVSGSGDNTLRIWDLDKGQAVSLNGHTSSVFTTAFSHDGKRLVSGGGDPFTPGKLGELKVWDLEKNQEVFSLKGHTNLVSSVAVSPDDKRLVSAGGDPFRPGSPGELKVWDLENGQEVLSVQGNTSAVYSVAFSPNGKLLFSGGADKTLKVWDSQNGQEALSLKGHAGMVQGVSFSSDGKRIVSCSGDGSHYPEVKVWDAEKGREVLSFRRYSGTVSSVGFSPDGNPLAIHRHDRTVKVWNAKTGKEVLSLGHIAPVTSVAFSPNGKRIVTTSSLQDQAAEDENPLVELKVWDTDTGKEIRTLKGHTGQVTSVAISADGKRIVSGIVDNTVKVWDADKGAETLTLKGHTDKVLSVAISADGKHIVSGSGDNTVKVWDAEKGTETLTLKGDTNRVYSVAISADGKRIVSGSGDNTVKVWDADKGTARLTLKGHTAQVTSVAFSADGKRIVSGSADNTVRVWDADKGSESAR